MEEGSNYSAGVISGDAFTGAVVPSPSVFDIGTQIDKETARLINVREADIYQKANAFVEAGKNINFVVEAFRAADDKYGDSFFEQDEKHAMSDQVAMQYLSVNKINMKHFGTVKNSKSQAHLDFLTKRIKERDSVDEMIQNNLGETGQTAAGVTGALFDIDVAVGLGAGAIWKSTSIMKIAAFEGGLEAALAVSRNAIKDDYTLGDGVFDIFMGTALAAGGTSAMQYWMRGKGSVIDDVNLPDPIGSQSDQAKELEAAMGVNRDLPPKMAAGPEVVVTPITETRRAAIDEELAALDTVEVTDGARLTELSKKYDTGTKKFDGTDAERAEFEKLNTESMDRVQKKYELEQERGDIEPVKLPDTAPEPTARVEPTLEEINTYLLPKEGSGSYTQFNIREEGKAARKYGRGTPEYNRRMNDIAYGKYQHMGVTTRRIARQTGKSFEWLRTPDGQEFAQKYLVEQNTKSMRADGVPITKENYYVYHQLGAPRAKRFFDNRLTNKDIGVLYDNLTNRAQKRAKGDAQKIVDEWTDAYAKGIDTDSVAAVKGKYDARIAAANKKIQDAKTPSELQKAQDELDALIVAKGRASNKAEVVTHASRRDSDLGPTRSDTYRTNRENFFGKQRGLEVEASLKRLDELEASRRANEPESPEQKKLQKDIDAEMNKLYEDSFNSPTARMVRAIDEMDQDVQGLVKEIDVVRKEVGDDEFLKILDEVALTHPKEIGAITDLVTGTMDKESIDAFIKAMVGGGIMPKKTAVAVALLLGGSSLHAGDDNIAGYLTAAFLAAVATPVLLPVILKAIRKRGVRGSLGHLANSTRKGWAKSAARAEQSVGDEANKLRRIGATIADAAHTRFTSTIAPFKKAGGDALKIAEDLLYSADKGAGAEIDKASWVHSTMARYNDFEVSNFKLWKNEKQQALGDGSTMTDALDKNQFRIEVTDAIELRSTKPDEFAKLPKSLRDMADEFEVLKKEIYDRAAEYNVLGFVDKEITLKDGTKKTIKAVQHKEGMMPRYWNSARMTELINKADDVEGAIIGLKASLTKAFYKSVHDADAAKRMADDFVDDWASGENLKGSGGLPRRGDDIFSAIEDLLKDGTDIDDLSKAMAVPKDRVARAKERIPLNPMDIEPFTIKIDGEDFTFDRNILIDRDAKSILDKTANSLYGAAAIGKRGYESVTALDNAIAKATKGILDGDTLRNELHQVTDLVMGVPIPSNNKFVHNISMAMKDMTIVSKLPLVTLSMPPELIATLTTSSLLRGLRTFKRALFQEFGKDSNMIQMLSMTGLGTSVKRLDFTGFRGYGDVAENIDDVGAMSAIRDKTMKMRDLSLIVNGLAYFSDGLQRMSMELHLEKIASYINKSDVNTWSGIPETRLKEFGIDDEFKEMFKDTFELDGQTVKTFDSTKWSIRKRDKLAEVLRVMNQQTSPETTLGETGLYTRTTDIGRSISGLLTYPMGQFNQYGLNDLRHLDKGAFMHSTGAFMGAYIGLSARYAIQGKEVSEEDMVMYSLLNIPQLGAFTTLKSMLDPAPFGVAKDAANLLLPEQLENR